VVLTNGAPLVREYQPGQETGKKESIREDKRPENGPLDAKLFCLKRIFYFDGHPRHSSLHLQEISYNSQDRKCARDQKHDEKKVN